MTTHAQFTQGDRRRTRSARRLLRVAVMLMGAEIALYRLWPLLDDNDPPPSLEQQLAITAALFLLGLPHVIAALGRRDRPWLLTVAGTVGIVLTAVSVIGHSIIFITIPVVLIPSIFYLARGSTSTRAPVSITGLATVVTVFAVGAAAAFFLTEDPRCSILVRREGRLVYEEPEVCDPSSSGRLGAEVVEWSASSDGVGIHESLLSLFLSAAAIALCVRAGGRESNRSAMHGPGDELAYSGRREREL